VQVGDERLQVKSLRQTGTRPRRTLSPIRSEDYTAVVIVVFDDDLRVIEALRVPRTVVNDMFPHRPHVNGRIIHLGRRLREHPDVEQIPLSDDALDHQC
jgi:hypothetical protein